MSKNSSVEVAIRIRPMRTELSEEVPAWEVHHNKITERHNPDCNFVFDRVYGTHSETEDVYQKSVKDAIVSRVAQGYNGTVFAYGQTGSGKSFTMLGGGLEDRVNEGVTNMAVRDLFALLEKEKAKGMKVNVYVAMLEIYNEQLRDLLVEPGSVSLPLSIRENEHGVYVHNAVRRPIKNADQCLTIIHNEAEGRRVSAATAMNERSSRSHCLIRILVEKTQTFDIDSDADSSDGEETLPPQKLEKKIVSSLNLVDLAGSERVAKTGATGIRMVEGGHINKSLTILTTVINRLTEGSKSVFKHVPYRDSKLTHLLKTAIGGNSFTAVFCCMTPAEQHSDESRSTLHFAARAKTIKNAVQMNEVADPRTKIREMEIEVKKLKRTLVAMDIYMWSKDLKIKLLKEQGGSMVSGSGGGGAAVVGRPSIDNAKVDQMEMLIEQLTSQNEQLQEALKVSESRTLHLDPMAVAAAAEDDNEKRELKSQIEELEQMVLELSEDKDATQQSLDELEQLCAELEEENDKKTSESGEQVRRIRELEGQVGSLKQVEASQKNQITTMHEKMKNDDQKMLERVRGDELLENLTKLHVEHQALQFEQTTLMDLYSRSEIDRATQIECLEERIRELDGEKEQMRESFLQHNSFLWRLLSVASLATHGKRVSPDEVTMTVREHQVDSAEKSLTAFISSRSSRPPGIALSSHSAAATTDGDSSTTKPPTTTSSTELPATESLSEKALQQKITELENQLTVKDAQRDIIIDAKLKRIQDLVMRFHTTNTRLTQELATVCTQNQELRDVIQGNPKMARKLESMRVVPGAEELTQTANFTPPPVRPWGHN